MVSKNSWNLAAMPGAAPVHQRTRYLGLGPYLSCYVHDK